MLCNIVYQESRNMSRLSRETKRVVGETANRTIYDKSGWQPLTSRRQLSGQRANGYCSTTVQTRSRHTGESVPSLRSSFHSLSRPSCHVSLASKPISYLHLRFLIFATSTRLFQNLQVTFSDVYLFIYTPLCNNLETRFLSLYCIVTMQYNIVAEKVRNHVISLFAVYFSFAVYLCYHAKIR